MSGLFTHSPSKVIRQLIVDLGEGTLPSESAAWPVFATHKPDSPDRLVTVSDTAGIDFGRTMTDGERQVKHGFQIMIRAEKHDPGYLKSNQISIALDGIVLRGVTVDMTGYLIQSISRTTDVLVLGKETPESKRNLFTVNGIVTMRQV